MRIKTLAYRAQYAAIAAFFCHYAATGFRVMAQGFIWCYQLVVSPFVPMSCRFYPTCSDYALSALEHYGVMKGLWKASGRLLRCHPWANGGFDPVLPNEEKL